LVGRHDQGSTDMSTHEPPPPVINMARVIAYAFVEGHVRWTGNQRLYVGGALLGAVPRLALCQSLRGSLNDILLHHCDHEWAVLGTSGAPTLDSAKEQAERAYKGISPQWVHVDISPEAAEGYLRKFSPGAICAFCNRLQCEVDGLVEGEHASICYRCINDLHLAIHGESGEGAN
jgi:ClpX C4-type zinc finger